MLQEMIAQKMSLLEGSGEELKPQVEGRIQKQEQLMSKINTIYTNKGISNQEKIAEMKKIFNEQINPFHKQLIRELVENTAQENIEEALSLEFQTKLEALMQITAKF